MMPDLHQTIANLLSMLHKTDKTLHTLIADATAIQARYDPVTFARSQFKNWSKSHEGKTWKKQEFKRIGGVCPGCSQHIHFYSFQIDHIKPLSKYPELAIALSNLQLLCGPCNTRKCDNCP